MRARFAALFLSLAAACSDGAVRLGSVSSGATGASTTGAATAAGTATGGTTAQTASSGGGSTGLATSSNGGSTGGAASSGGATTGGQIADCLDAGGQTEFALICSTDFPCACPMSCVTDPQLGMGFASCEFPCQTSADCQNPGERCLGGACSIDECGQGDGGNGVIWGACNSLDAGDGTCALPAGPQRDLIVPLFDFSPAVFVCEQSGTSTGPCSLLATRADDSLRCAAGLVCNPNVVGLDGGASGLCVHGCDPTAPNCPAGEVCSGSAPREGYCYVLGEGGCAVGLPGDSYQGCDNSAQCACPNTCVADPGLEGSYCEPPCMTTTDCLNVGTVCISGSCEVNFCAQSPSGVAPGSYDHTCTAVSGQDGTCLPTPAPLANEVGVCVRGGTATTSCAMALDPGALVPAGSVVPSSELCPAGQVCAALADGGPSCAPVCDPDAGGCPAGTVCLEQDIFIPDFGVCGACLAPGAFCLQDGECCGGSCGSDAGPFVCP